MNSWLMIAMAATALTWTHPVRQTPQPADSLIVGRVVDGAGTLVTGVVVTLVPRNAGAPSAGREATDPPRLVLVDSSGRFVFSGLRAGNYDLIAMKRGFVSGGSGKLRPDGTGWPLALAEHERRTDVTLRVWKQSSISGTVVDDAGEPVVGVKVQVLRRDWIAGALRLVVTGSTALTDDRGAYRVGALLPGDYVVMVPSSTTTLPGSVLDLYDAPRPSPEAKSVMNLLSLPPAPASGRTGLQVEDFVVTEGLPMVGLPRAAADGHLQIFPTAFLPETPRTTGGALTIQVGAGESKSVPPLQLQSTLTAKVSGRLMAATGETAPGGTPLMLIPQFADSIAGDSGYSAAQTVTGSGGAFTFLSVPPGTYRLLTPMIGRYWLNEIVTVTRSDLSLSAVMRSAFTVSGQLVFQGQAAQPRPGQTARDVVTVVPADGKTNASVGRDTGGPPGSFTIEDLPGGRYVLRPSRAIQGWTLKSIARNGEDLMDVPLDVTEDIRDLVVTYTDQPSTLRGTVRTRAGAPEAGALVVIFPARAERWVDGGRTPLRMRGVRVGPAGTYSLSGLPPGDYFLAAVDDTWGSRWQTPEFLATLSRQAARIRIEPGTPVVQDLQCLEAIK